MAQKKTDKTDYLFKKYYAFDDKSLKQCTFKSLQSEKTKYIHITYILVLQTHYVP